MGLVCRVVEEAGVATVCVSTGRDITAQVKPPRSVFVNHPMGNNFGKPSDVETQRTILKAAIDLAASADEAAVLIDLPCGWPEPFEYFRGQVSSSA